MTPELQTLQTRLTNDPNNRGYATPISNGNRSAVLALANEPVIGSTRPLTPRELIGGLWSLDVAHIIMSSTDASATGLVHQITTSVQLGAETIDLSLASIQGGISAMVTAGVITQAQADSIKALANTKVGDAFDAIGRDATISDLRQII